MPTDFSESPIDDGEDVTKSSAAPQRSFPEFEGYQIVDELPRGGQAFVYKAIHKATKTKVALKVLTPGSLASAKARLRFEREVDFISGLKHPYIVSIRDSGISEGHYYFAMEYLRGLPLDEYISVQALSFREIIELFAKICDATTHAHQHGVIHRDLKPSNILVDKRGDPHVLDFGLAKSAGNLGDTPSVVSMSGEIKGTLAYMSPEQATGQADLLDIRTDVYSLGVILYQLLTGRFPYDVSGTTAQILSNIERVEPTRPRTTVSRFSSEVEAIILKALEKNPKKRYQSTAELWEDLRRWLAGDPVIAKSISSIYIIRKLIGKHMYASVVVTLLMVIVLNFTFAAGYFSRRTKKAENESAVAEQDRSEMAGTVGRNLKQVVFLNFLKAWHGNDSKRKKLMAASLQIAQAHRETRAVAHLGKAEQGTEADTGFREGFSTHERWFADLVLGERYLKLNDQQRAWAAYLRSHRAMDWSDNGDVSGDALYKQLVASRLYRLTPIPK